MAVEWVIAWTDSQSVSASKVRSKETNSDLKTAVLWWARSREKSSDSSTALQWWAADSGPWWANLRDLLSDLSGSRSAFLSDLSGSPLGRAV